MTQNNAFIVFSKKPILGKVKTRIAKTVGDQTALSIYRKLLSKSNALAMQVHANVYIFHGGQIDRSIYTSKQYQHQLQVDGGIGYRMRHALSFCLQNNEKAILVGTDIPEITPSIIKSAFDALDKADVVFGPANDGGYYLVGLKKMNPAIFDLKHWSTATVLEDTLAICAAQKIKYSLVTKLSDIDTEEDWNAYLSRNGTKL